MKKVLTILVLAALIPACVFASSLFGFSAGITAAYQKADVGAATAGDIDVKGVKWEDFKYGIDTDLKIAFIDVNAKSFIAKTEADESVLNGIISANVAVDLAFVRVKAGLGYQYAYNMAAKTFSFGNGTSVDSFENFKAAQFDIYTGVDVKLGSVIIGVYATLPTSVSIEKNNWNELIPTIQDNWQKAQFGLSFGYSFF